MNENATHAPTDAAAHPPTALPPHDEHPHAARAPARDAARPGPPPQKRPRGGGGAAPADPAAGPGAETPAVEQPAGEQPAADGAPPPPESKKKWYVVKVQSGREETIKSAVERK